MTSMAQGACQANFDYDGNGGKQELSRECSTEIYKLDGTASYGCYDKSENSFSSCNNITQESGRSCTYEENDCLVESCYHWEKLEDSRVWDNTCYGGNKWRKKDGSWDPKFGCSANFGFGYIGGFKKFARRCRNNADETKLATDAKSQCESSIVSQNVGNYVLYSGYDFQLTYSTDGGVVDGVFVYVDLGQHNMHGTGGCHVAADINSCTGTCSITKSFVVQSCYDYFNYCNSANGYYHSTCGGSLFVDIRGCYCHCCYGKDDGRCRTTNEHSGINKNDMCYNYYDGPL